MVKRLGIFLRHFGYVCLNLYKVCHINVYFLFLLCKLDSTNHGYNQAKAMGSAPLESVEASHALGQGMGMVLEVNKHCVAQPVLETKF